jgi:hypothetical protein
MKKLTRENQIFFSELERELQNEIIEKNFLKPFISQVSNTKKREEGHSKAQSYVDFLLNNVFPFCETLKKYGLIVQTSDTEREHGDFYLLHVESKTKISCNGKFGSSKKMGQPNMCSIERAVDYLDEHNLPYLIFKLRKVNGDFRFCVFDIYNSIKHLGYNDGPGQIMLSESKFYKNKSFEYLKTKEVMVYLCNIQDEGYRRLLESREVKNKKFKEIKEKYERE